MTTRRVAAVLAVVAITATACTSGAGGELNPAISAPSGAGTDLVALRNVPGGPREHAPSALSDANAKGLPTPLVDSARIEAGGPPPDGIAPVDHPLFQRARTVDWLRPQEPVLALDINGDHRAYPEQVMIWHEIANDTVGGVPVAVTYCPLCNTAIAFDRRAAGRVLDFGTSGKLYNSDLVAYHRQTESLWVQLLGRAVAGVLTGTTLRAFPVQTVSWEQWGQAHPDGWVLGRVDAGRYDYGANPYPGYDDVRSRPFLYDGPVDNRLTAKTRIVGVHIAAGATAITLDTLRTRRVVPFSDAGRVLVAWWTPGTRSPLAADTIADGTDIGATGVFDPRRGGRVLHFTAAGERFRDRETRSTWTVLGRAVAGPVSGQQLRPIRHVDTFWFAWAAFLPHTRLVSS